jgi:hypothetical protein
LQQKAGHRSGKYPGFSPDELRVAFSIPSGSLFLVNHLVLGETQLVLKFGFFFIYVGNKIQTEQKRITPWICFFFRFILVAMKMEKTLRANTRLPYVTNFVMF